ncbi:ATP-dependent DNA ligase domain-containing protein, partial [Pseudogymnoascus destructans 20631-21]
AHISSGTVKLLTRTGIDWTTRFQPIAKALKTLKIKSAIIDGEAVVEDEGGVTSFVKLVEALESGQSAEMVFIGFDLLYLDGVDVTSGALTDRKELLKAVLSRSRSKHLRYSEHMTSDGATILKEACSFGLEGIISKRTDRPYRSGRNGEWL